MANIKRLEEVAIPSTPKEIKQRYLRRFTNKACKWWDKELREVNYGTYDEAINAFRKYMEEDTK